MKKIMIWASRSDQFDILSDEDAGKLIKAIFKYFLTGEEQELSPQASMLFSIIKSDLANDKEHYEDVCKKRKENIEKRWKKRESEDTKVYKCIQENTNGYNQIQNDTNDTNINNNINNNNNINSNLNNNNNINYSCTSTVHKEKEQEFIVPTIEDVESYCKANSLNIDCRKFFNHYSENGWRTNGVQIKSWKAIAKSWSEADKQKVTSVRSAVPVQNTNGIDYGQFAGLDYLEQATEEQRKWNEEIENREN